MNRAYVPSQGEKRKGKGKKLFDSLEHLGKNPGSTEVIGTTPINFSWAKLSLLTSVKYNLGKK